MVTWVQVDEHFAVVSRGRIGFEMDNGSLVSSTAKRDHLHPIHPQPKHQEARHWREVPGKLDGN